MAEEQRPRILYFKEFIPTSVCILLSLFFAMVFQFNGGVFLPTSVQMSSALGCLKEDVMMAGYASFIGMTVIFPILFRLKFRFTTRQIFMMVCSGTYLLQPGDDARAEYLHTGRNVLYFRFFQNVGYI